MFAQGVFELRFAFFLPPDEPDTLYCFGPWADGPRSKESLEWCEKYLDEKARNVVEEYYNRARQMEDNAIKTSLFAVISLCCSRKGSSKPPSGGSSCRYASGPAWRASGKRRSPRSCPPN